MPPTTLRVQQALGGKTTSTCVPQVHPLHGTSSVLRSMSITFQRVLWTANVRSSATSHKEEGLLTSTAMSSTGWPITQLKRSPPTPRSRKASVGDSTLGCAMSLIFMTLPPSRSLSKGHQGRGHEHPTEFRKHPRDDSSSSSGPQKRRI